MKFLLVVAAVVAVVVAGPTGRFTPVPLPGIVSGEPIHVGPALVDFPVPESALNPTPVAPSSPLVQIIVNVNQPETNPAPGEIVEEEEIPADPVIVDDGDDQVIVEDHPIADFEPVIVAPIEVIPAVVEPDNLN